jgi:hypothetical protein
MEKDFDLHKQFEIVKQQYLQNTRSTGLGDTINEPHFPITILLPYNLITDAVHLANQEELLLVEAIFFIIKAVGCDVVLTEMCDEDLERFKIIKEKYCPDTNPEPFKPTIVPWSDKQDSIGTILLTNIVFPPD